MLKLDKSKNTGIIFIYDLVGYEFKINKDTVDQEYSENITLKKAFKHVEFAHTH